MKIFISYRHNDKPELVELITRELNNRKSVSEVFQDIFSIPPGIEFDKYILHQIKQMDVVLVIVGVKWVEEFEKRDNIHDFVLIEVETALKSDKLTIPILIDGAKMPLEDDLPDSIKPFARRNAIVVRAGRDLDKDIDDLLSQLRESLNLHQNISSSKPGERLILLQDEDLNKIWTKTQAHIYDQVYKNPESKLIDIPRLLNQAELLPLEFHTIVYAVSDLETFKFLNTSEAKTLIEDTLSEVIGVRVFTICKLLKRVYFDYDSYHEEYVTLEEELALEQEVLEQETLEQETKYSPPPSDLDDIPF